MVTNNEIYLLPWEATWSHSEITIIKYKVNTLLAIVPEKRENKS